MKNEPENSIACNHRAAFFTNHSKMQIRLTVHFYDKQGFFLTKAIEAFHLLYFLKKIHQAIEVSN
jgi:hypothetical protein